MQEGDSFHLLKDVQVELAVPPREQMEGNVGQPHVLTLS